MGIRRIDTILPVVNSTYRDRIGCCRAVVRLNIFNSKGEAYTIFETEDGSLDLMEVKSFKEYYFDSSRYDLEPGDIFQIHHEGPDGDAGAIVYFLFLSDQKVIRIGYNWHFLGHSSSATLDRYVDEVANGDYSKIVKVDDIRSHGYKIEENS